MDPFNQQQNQNSRSLSSTTDPSQYTQYQHPSSSQMAASYPPSSHLSQTGGVYQPIPANATHAYQQQQQQQQMSAHAYSMSQSGPYPGATVYPGSAHHHATGSRSASTPSGQAYSAHGTMSPPHPSLQQQANTQYVGQHQQAMYPAPGYGYVQHPQSGAVMPPNSRPPPSPASSQVFQTDHLGRRVSASSGHRSASPPSPGIERFLCHKCDKSFSRAHDRKRHYETQHSSHPPLHKCPFCKKEFSRADSLKRHLDNGCEKDPSFTGGSSLTAAS
ncbi:hypothetical protein PHLCEN_2v4198 [Hermanssonia centrifuga]|uniref:C2H2-type domain-containing protein n=1 Tax=Hermanssonia centrifuga TaxID=98765 RepID=A0A2R6PYY2_9APHY|nr:hypothetical protein PHLCEN_2v4198 [Hermanssonia centrifuga]